MCGEQWGNYRRERGYRLAAEQALVVAVASRPGAGLAAFIATIAVMLLGHHLGTAVLPGWSRGCLGECETVAQHRSDHQHGSQEPDEARSHWSEGTMHGESDITPICRIGALIEIMGFRLRPAPPSIAEDAALSTLLLPFASGALQWPAGNRVLFLRARAGSDLPVTATEWVCEQSFRPYADALERAGLRALPAAGEGTFDLVLALPPRQREESRALLARALQRVAPGGIVVASLLNTEGARSAEADLASLAGQVHSLSKNKCRAFWAAADAAKMDAARISEWAVLDAPRPIADGRFLSRPGLFAWDRIDAASALLASCLPADLSGRGADLGAGTGYLSAELLARCPGVVLLDLYEAEARALDLARLNLAGNSARAKSVELAYHWHDVTRGLPTRHDFIVSNPPFHLGRADQPDLGRAFIASAAAALKPRGSLWLVANRHLPYEAALAQGFTSVRTVKEQDGFKVIEAIKADA